MGGIPPGTAGRGKALRTNREPTGNLAKENALVPERLESDHPTASPKRKMTDIGRLQVYASWAEVASAVAVVLSVIYLSTEFRRSAMMNVRNADNVLYARISDEHRMVVQTPGLAETIVLAEQAPGDLTPADRRRYLTLQDHFFNTWEMAWYYHEDGILSDAIWSEWNDMFTAEARSRPDFGWTGIRHRYTYVSTGSKFQAHVDSILSPHD